MWAIGPGLETEHSAKGPFQNLTPRGHWPEPSPACGGLWGFLPRRRVNVENKASAVAGADELRGLVLL